MESFFLLSSETSVSFQRIIKPFLSLQETKFTFLVIEFSFLLQEKVCLHRKIDKLFLLTPEGSRSCISTYRSFKVHNFGIPLLWGRSYCTLMIHLAFTASPMRDQVMGEQRQHQAFCELTKRFFCLFLFLFFCFCFCL